MELHLPTLELARRQTTGTSPKTSVTTLVSTVTVTTTASSSPGPTTAPPTGQPVPITISGSQNSTIINPSSQSNCSASSASTPAQAGGSKSGYLSSGAAAGAAVGAAIGAALITAVAFFFLMKGRKRQQPLFKHSNRPRKGSDGGFGQSTQSDGKDVENSPEKSLRSANLEYILPQPLDDSSLKAEVDKFRKLVEDHVDSNYYDDQPTKHAVSRTDVAAALPATTSVLHDLRIDALLDDPRTRFNTLKAAVASEMLAAIAIDGNPQRSILPEIVTCFMKMISLSRDDNHRTALSISRWRTSTALLLGDKVGEEDGIHRERAVQGLLRSLDTVLKPFAVPGTEEARKEHLFGVCKRAEHLGMLLLSQPAEWSFDWNSLPKTRETGERREPRKSIKPSLVVFPALVRLTDNTARKLTKPRLVLEARVKE